MTTSSLLSHTGHWKTSSLEGFGCTTERNTWLSWSCGWWKASSKSWDSLPSPGRVCFIYLYICVLLMSLESYFGATLITYLAFSVLYLPVTYMCVCVKASFPPSCVSVRASVFFRKTWCRISYFFSLFLGLYLFFKVRASVLCVWRSGLEGLLETVGKWGYHIKEKEPNLNVD